MKPLALTVLLCSSLLASAPAHAEEKGPKAAAAAAVQEGLVAPLTAKESRFSRFSRARRPPIAHRVRLLDETPSVDAKGEAFFRFALDSSIGFAKENDKEDDESRWDLGTETGCVYASAGKVFVHRGDRHFPARLVVGEKVQATPGACEAAPPRS
jgi:hypothetical protein